MPTGVSNIFFIARINNKTIQSKGIAGKINIKDKNSFNNSIRKEFGISTDTKGKSINKKESRSKKKVFSS